MFIWNFCFMKNPTKRCEARSVVSYGRQVPAAAMYEKKNYAVWQKLITEIRSKTKLDFEQATPTAGIPAWKRWHISRYQIPCWLLTRFSVSTSSKTYSAVVLKPHIICIRILSIPASLCDCGTGCCTAVGYRAKTFGLISRADYYRIIIRRAISYFVSPSK